MLSANDTLGFGVIGCGYFGRHYLRLLQEISGAALLAVADSSSENVMRPALPSSVYRTQRVDDLIAQRSVDCVVIATPPSTHFRIACDVLRAGKHVLIEKPMTFDLREALLLADVVAQSGKTLMIGHQYLYNDYIRCLKGAIDHGSLGAVRYVFAEHFYPGPIRQDIGCFWETAVHEFAILDFLFGLDVARVHGSATSFIEPRDGVIREDFASASLYLSSNILAHVVVSWFSPEKRRNMLFAGTNGFAMFDDCAPVQKLKFLSRRYPQVNASSVFFDKTTPSPFVVPEVRAKEPLRNELEHFVDCVRNKRAPLTDIAHGLRVARVLDAVQSSFVR